MSSPVAAIQTGVSYLARHPGTLFSMARNAAALRLTIPLDALRWAAARSKKGPSDVVLGDANGAVTFGATLDVMGAKLRAEAGIYIEEVRLGPDELRIAFRVADLRLRSLDGDASPMGQLLKSGAIDPSKPANLVNFMPKKPAALVEAKDDRFAVDLMKVPKLAQNARLRAILATFRPLVSIREVRAEHDQLLIGLRPHPMGVVSAAGALLAALRGG